MLPTILSVKPKGYTNYPAWLEQDDQTQQTSKECSVNCKRNWDMKRVEDLTKSELSTLEFLPGYKSAE